jgi:hypothetical protein
VAINGAVEVRGLTLTGGSGSLGYGGVVISAGAAPY